MARSAHQRKIGRIGREAFRKCRCAPNFRKCLLHETRKAWKKRR